MKILISEMIQELDENAIEKMIWDEHNKVKVSKLKIKWKVMKKLDKKKFWYRRILLTACFILMISILLPVTAKAAINYMLTHSALVDDTNKGLIGTEIIDKNYIIYKDGVYQNAAGDVIDFDKILDNLGKIPDNRIIKEIKIDHYTPSSIEEVVIDSTGKNSYATPEIILVNNSVGILTKEDGTGWNLEKGDTLEYSFEKYKSNVVEQQNLIIGYVKDGVMYEGQGYQDLSDSYVLNAQDKGEYFIYLLSASSDYLTLKQGKLIQSGK